MSTITPTDDDYVWTGRGWRRKPTPEERKEAANRASVTKVRRRLTGQDKHIKHLAHTIQYEMDQYCEMQALKGDPVQFDAVFAALSAVRRKAWSRMRKQQRQEGRGK